MRADKDVSNLVEKIYDAALHPNLWEQVLLELAAHFNSDTAGMWVHTADAASRLSKMVGRIDDAEMSFYNQHLAEENPWYQVPGLMRPGCALTDTTLEILHKNKRAFTQTLFYQEWLKKLELRHVLGGTLLDTAGSHLNFTFLRNAQAGRYSEREIKEFGTLSRHVCKAIEISVQIDARRWAQQLCEASLNQLTIGFIIVDTAGRIVFANAKAEALLQLGTTIVLRNSRLAACATSDSDRLQTVINKLAVSGGHEIIAMRNVPATSLTLYLSGNLDTNSFLSVSKSAVTIFIVDSMSNFTEAVNRLKQVWGLSSKEAQFAELILKGFSIKESAEALQITFETARWYCKQVMQKVGVSRQSQLVGKLLRSTLINHASKHDLRGRRER